MLNDLSLSEDERRYLAIQAYYRAEHYQDPRYYRNISHSLRNEKFKRWIEISRQLHPKPFGE